MFPRLFTWNLSNLVEINHTQNKLQIFIEKPLKKKINEQSSWHFFFFFFFFFCGGCVLLGVDGEV